MACDALSHAFQSLLDSASASFASSKAAAVAALRSRSLWMDKQIEEADACEKLAGAGARLCEKLLALPPGVLLGGTESSTGKDMVGPGSERHPEHGDVDVH